MGEASGLRTATSYYSKCLVFNLTFKIKTEKKQENYESLYRKKNQKKFFLKLDIGFTRQRIFLLITLYYPKCLKNKENTKNSKRKLENNYCHQIETINKQIEIILRAR